MLPLAAPLQVYEFGDFRVRPACRGRALLLSAARGPMDSIAHLFVMQCMQGESRVRLSASCRRLEPITLSFAAGMLTGVGLWRPRLAVMAHKGDDVGVWRRCGSACSGANAEELQKV